MRIPRLLIGLLFLGLGVVAALQAADRVVASFAALRVYPNPWRADRHAHFFVTFDGLPANATLRLFALNGHAIKTLKADADGKAFWDRTNQNGDAVASGLYLYTASSGDIKPIVGRLTLIR
jgi:hypothetical protein